MPDLGLEGTDLGLEGLDPWLLICWFPSFLSEDSCFFLFLSEDSIFCCVGSWTKIMYLHIGSEQVCWIDVPTKFGSEFHVGCLGFIPNFLF
jgi:hypothetical protein